MLRQGAAVMFEFVAKFRGVWPRRWIFPALSRCRAGDTVWLVHGNWDVVSDRTIGSVFVANRRLWGDAQSTTRKDDRWKTDALSF